MAPALILLTLLFVAPDVVAPEPRAPLIYGGEAVGNDELNQVVALQIGPVLCTGTVVAPTLVITAAHCLASNPDAGDIKVKIGNDINAPLAVVSASSWAAHPDFCKGCEQDIRDFAYVVLEQPINYDDGFAPPPIDNAEFEQYMQIDQAVVLAGFGEDEEKNRGLKRKVTVKIREFSEGGGEFLAGESGKDSCLGDSGGPALLMLPDDQLRLGGVLSRGFACGEGGFYGIPAPVLCWIRDETGVELAEDCAGFDTPTNPDQKCGGCSTDEHTPTGAIAMLAVLLGLSRRRARLRSNV